MSVCVCERERERERERQRERTIGKNVCNFDDLVLSQSLKQCLFENMLL